MSNIDDTLAARGNRYGEFVDHAEVTQSIKCAMASGNNWDTLPDDMKECMEMVAHKFGRILNGDPYYIDSWTDIIGYTRLVEKRLIAEAEPELGQDEDEDLGECPCSVCTARRAAEKPEDGPTSADVVQALAILLKAGVIKESDEQTA